MLEFTVYDPKTGQILRCGRCQDASLAAQAGSGERVIEGRFPDDEFRIVDGKPVAIPPAPDHWSEFDHAKGQWVDKRSLDDLREAARREVLAAASVAVAPILSGYPPHEIASFGAKLTDARLVLAGIASPEIEAEAQARGITSAEMAQRIIAKGEPAATKMRAVDGYRGAAFAAIQNAKDAAEIAECKAKALTAISAKTD